MISTAAALFLIGGYLAYQFSSDQQKSTLQQSYTYSSVQSGRNMASIVLPGGKMVALSSAKSGIVMGAEVLTYSDGSRLESVDKVQELAGITSIATPRGGTYQVVLKDGTRVQLNAASSISFDADFGTHNERTVQLSGEAYFEVAKHKRKPFIVVSTHQKIKVLGTHFNVSAYPDDKYTLTTLLEGSIAINDKLLKPNDQAKQYAGDISIYAVDPKKAVDWKNGEFIFEQEALSQMMKKIGRWYDVDISFESEQLKTKSFSGSLSRYARLEDLLKALKFAGINSRIRDRKIEITN